VWATTGFIFYPDGSGVLKKGSSPTFPSDGPFHWKLLNNGTQLTIIIIPQAVYTIVGLSATNLKISYDDQVGGKQKRVCMNMQIYKWDI
jgi:hypothetical protein